MYPFFSYAKVRIQIPNPPKERNIMENKICLLLSAASDYDFITCKRDRCAWWDCLACACCLASAADYTRAISDSLESVDARKEDDTDE